LKNLDEVVTFLTTYFKVVDLGYRDLVEIVIIKARGDEILRNCSDASMKSRRLSLTDASLIYLATKRRVPIVTGNKDLSYVARSMGIEVLW